MMGFGTRKALRVAAAVFATAALVSTELAEARFVTDEQFVRLEDFEDTYGQGFGKVDRSVVGFLDLLQRFSFASFIQRQEGGPALAPVSQFGTFIREARSSLDSVPIPSGSASVAYAYDANLATFVAQERPLTPALSQNAYTSGKGILTVGASVSYLDFDEFDDQDHDNSIFLVSTASAPVGDFQIADAMYFNFKLRETVVGLSLQYGILDNLDFGIFIPVVDLDFHAKGTSSGVVKGPNGITTLGLRNVPKVTDLRQSDFPAAIIDPEGPFILPTGVRYDKEKTAVSDIVLRTKLYLGEFGGVDFGTLLNLSLPSGDEDNLLGTGSTRIDPRLLVSTSHPSFAMHVNAGPHVDTDDSDLTRFDYSAGGEVRITDWMAILLDQVGRVQTGGDKIEKFEIVPGVKVKLPGSVVAGFNAIVPLNHEGLTTGFTPNVAGDFSYAF